MMALLVGVAATPAQAVTFSYSFNGCSGDSVCVTPVFGTGSTPDSIQFGWFTSANTIGSSYALPFDTCFLYNGNAGRDSLVMTVWYSPGDVDTTISRSILADYMIAMGNGRDVDENGTVGVDVLDNDTTSTPDSVITVAEVLGNVADHGTVDSIIDDVIWYTPDLGYNGTDDFAYRATNECGDLDTAVVSITIESDGLLSFDSCDYQWVDVPCACDDSAEGLGTISIGDSIRVRAWISAWDLDELTPGWPRVDLPGLGGLNLVMVQDTSADLAMLDTTMFAWPGRIIDSSETWFVVDDQNLDVAAGFYEIVTRARSNVSPFLVSACTTIVDQAIDNNGPDEPDEATWTLWTDVNGDGIATTVDSMRFFVDLRNEPFEEICEVCVTTYGFPFEDDTSAAGGYNACLAEIAGDNRWGWVFEVPPGDLENLDGPFTAVIRYTDNACNMDSVTVTYDGPVDNTAPICDNITWDFEFGDDLDSNNCISLGESVHIEICDTNSGNNDVTYWLSVFSDTNWRFGLGSQTEGDVSHDSIPFTLSGDCGELDWTLGMFPLENAIDTTAIAGAHPWVYLFAVDDAGNPFVCDSLQIIWDDPNPAHDELDARPPQPMHLDACYEDTTFLGTRAVRIRFSDVDPDNGPGFGDIARFRLFYDNGTGVIDYADTLAGLSWDDTTGGAGTDGLIRIDANTFEWTTDGTVELSWCRDYLFNVWVKDSCGNLEYLHPDSILCEGTNPAPVADLSCESMDALNICLTWTTHEPQADSFQIWMATNEVDDGLDDTAHYVASVAFTDTGAEYTWCTDDESLVLISNRRYDFYVITVDTCGNSQEEFFASASHTQCLADLAPPVVCVFQPATLSPEEDTIIYSCDRCEFLPSGPFDPEEPDGMWIYTKPCNDTSIDVTDIDSVLIRLADSAGTPGRWVHTSFDAFAGPNHWAIRLNCDERGEPLQSNNALYETVSLNDLVREDDSVEVIQVVVFGHDEADRAATLDEIVDCCGYFEFVWSNYWVDVFVNTMNGEVRTYQPLCGFDGFLAAANGENTVEVHIEAGVPPYKIRAAAAPSDQDWADEEDHQVFYMEGIYDTIVNITFSTVGWQAGMGEFDVEVCDAEGNHGGETEIPICVPDTVAPCALISNPVDGKCIRRSRSMLDPVWVCIQFDPLQNCIDQTGILKVDYQWSQECCTGFVVDTVCEFVPCEVDTVGFEDGQACTTYANPGSPFFGQTFCHDVDGPASACTVYTAFNTLDSTICWQSVTDTSCRIEVCHLEEVPCENVFEWNTFSILPGDSVDWIENDIMCTQWWNTEDLAWITQSGTIIYLRAIIYDEMGNIYTTPCAQVCVDIDETPLCLETPDICPSNGYWAIGGGDSDHDGESEHKVTFYANMDLDSSNVDDIEDVSLWFKKSTDPDLFDYWCEVGSGFFGENAEPGGTNSTVWRWDIDLDSEYGGCSFSDNISYDFRVIVTSITGTTSHDANGDGNFDANTFDSTACDMNTYYIDKSAPQVAMDTVWTTVNGEEIVQPNVSCAMSDPRGWAWTQFGNEMTVQPNVYPWTGTDGTYYYDDIKRVRWTLYDDTHLCECGPGFNIVPFPQGSCFDEECGKQEQGLESFIFDDTTSGWLVADFQGSDPMRNLTFNPADAPWWPTQSPPTGVQNAILRVEVWDSCGNRTADCINLYLLDMDPTDVILVEPENDQVFCTEPGGDADEGILLRAASILEEGWNKVIYAYRPAGTTEWIEFDSVGISSDPDRTWQQRWTEVLWEPIAMGLAPGDYELTAWGVDNALNRSEFTYVVTVHLSCSAPTVQLIHPTSENPEFIGCPIDVEAIASTGDPWNPVVRVDFYYVRVIDDLSEAHWIGFDLSTIDEHYGVHWENPSFEGPHYMYAEAENKAGQRTRSELVWVKGDDTDPWARVAQVGDDLSNGNIYNDPTVIPAGNTVDIWGFARDVEGGWGAGEIDNCGVDSVIFYVWDDEHDKVFGAMMQPDNVVDSLYHTLWNTTGLMPGDYYVQMRVFDCACNDGESLNWNVEIVGPDQDPVISVVGDTVCGYVTVDDYAEVTVSFPYPEYVDYVQIAYGNSIYSDVEDRYEWTDNCYVYESNGDTYDWYFSIPTSEWEEGLYRFRAVVFFTDGTMLEDSDGDGDFEDFTFNTENSWHMLVRVDHGVSPFTITPVGGETFKAHTSVCFNVDIADTCDFDHVHWCADVDDEPPSWENLTSEELSFCFNPTDSSCVTLNSCGVWSGEIPMTVCDAFDDYAHCETVGVPIWILDVAGPDTALITEPQSGSYFTANGANVVSARKLSSSGIDSVQFYYAASQTNGTVSYIGSSVADGDEFSKEWNVENVADGGYYLFARAYNNNVSKDGPRCVFVTVAKDCEALSLTIPNPSYTRVVNGQTIRFVGDRVDLCIERDSVSSGAPVDSVVWYFRQASAPGLFPWENDDPFAGYVRIAKDTYGSLCVDWWTDWCRYSDYYGDNYIDWLNSDGPYDTTSYSDCCSDGRFTIVAYVFDAAGNVCHSVPTTVNIDNTEPYSEIVDIDGDETFGDCHNVALPADSVLKISANAIDLTCAEGALPPQAYASGAAYLQFFAGGCGGSGAGPIDVLFVVDGSYSMRNGYYGNNLTNFATSSTRFTDALAGRDVMYGVVGFSDDVSHDCEDNYPGQVIDADGNVTSQCDGIWTSNAGDLPLMLNGVNNTYLPYVGGQNDNNYEYGVWAIAQGLRNYDWRPNASRIVILVTDEDDDEAAGGFPPIELSFVEQSGATIYTILNSTATQGYNTLAPFTGGQVYDWGSSFASTFGAIASSILAGSNYNSSDVGIVWTSQTNLTDGQDDAFALWNISGLAEGEYCVWTKVIDQIGNVYESDRVSVCIEDRTPPSAYIAGFGKTTENCGDGCVTHEYTIYGQMCDEDVDYVQFQYRHANSNVEEDWTGIGVPVAVGCHEDNTLWMTKWNPCGLSAGPYELRVVPTDNQGNQDFTIQSIATVDIDHLDDGSCDVVPTEESGTQSGMWFEDKTFEQLGLVDLDLHPSETGFAHSMIAVWADLHGEIASECVALYAPDPEIPSWLMGSFDGIDAVRLGGEGWFWQAYRDLDNNVTHLRREILTVYPIRADLGGCNFTHPTLGAKVCIQPGALNSDNGVVVFPSRIPTVDWSQQHYQAWPAASTPRYPVVTAIHLTYPVESFNAGKWAEIKITYDEPSLDNSNLTVGWWDDSYEYEGDDDFGGQWDIEHEILPKSAITDASAEIFSKNLHGLYAVVSAGRQCISGAITVENAGMEKAVGNVTGPWPTIYTRVRSNIEFNNGNWDINEDEITVELDGNTIYANGDEAHTGWYEVYWDHVSGILTTNWIGPEECLTDDDYQDYDGDEGGGDSYDGIYAPALTAGTHTLRVQAFNDAGYCEENTYTFTVDRTSPNVVVAGYEDCANPTFHIKITDDGVGVDWENVFVDVFDVTGSEFSAIPKSRLIHTETYDAFNESLDADSGTFSFQLVSHIAQGHRLRIVIYIGDRYVYYNSDCNCEYVEYDHDCDGVQDLVGNRTQVVEEQYTIWGNNCSGGGGGEGGDGGVIIGSGSNNPFDPWAGQSITFDLQGFDGGGVVTAEVFDVAGVKVRDLAAGTISSTVGTVEWDGRNQDGEYVAQGVYLVHFARAGGQAAGPTSAVVKVGANGGAGRARTELPPGRSGAPRLLGGGEPNR